MQRRHVRGAFLATALLLVSVLAVGFVTAGQYPNARYATAGDEPVVPPRNGTTVVTTQGGMGAHMGSLVAFAPDGTVRYYTNRYSSYWDVDPSPVGESTISYVATQKLPKDLCGVPVVGDYCRLNVIERLNLSTGERTRLYAHRANNDDNRWHDADRIGEDRFVVAAIGQDTVFVVNVSSDVHTWTWPAEDHFNRSMGGNYHDDWTHINDVEELPDGRITVSVRNMDQVVFLDRGPDGGVVANWTLGREDAYSILREQHNPDYIPASRGGPAVLVADSENNRIVEYQREDGEWNRTWYWRDPRLQWPRDADRLPNGNTLITDTIGDRVIEVNENGTVVWSVPIDKAYEAERLSTGGESTGGKSAATLGLDSRGVGKTTPGVEGTLEHAIRSAVPTKIQNAFLGYFFPWWFGVYEFVVLFALLIVVLAWVGAEIWWNRDRIDVRNPIEIDGRPDWRATILVAAIFLSAVAGVQYALSFL